MICKECGKPGKAKGLCNTCYTRHWHRDNNDRSRSLANARYAKKPPEKKKEQNRRNRVGAYGLTLEAFQAMERGQNGCCAICARPPTKGNLNVDHCHETGRVRGLLCKPCNTALGALGDNAEGLRRALTYLTQE